MTADRLHSQALLATPMPAYVPLRGGIGERYHGNLEWCAGSTTPAIHRERLFQEVAAGREYLQTTIANLGPAVAMSVLLSMLESQSPDTYDHADRVSRSSVALARAMNLSQKEIRDIRHAGLLHDIGKLAVPRRVLGRTGPLTEEEIAVLRLHVTIGAEILRDVPSLSAIAPIVAGSHERFDGRGYPDGLMGSAIPLGARIIAVADSYDAMTARRPYADPMSVDDANNELIGCAGSYFDPDVVCVWMEMVQAPKYT
jgi:putative nucleotidyltransferase with HDIG domain